MYFCLVLKQEADLTPLTSSRRQTKASPFLFLASSHPLWGQAVWNRLSKYECTPYYRHYCPGAGRYPLGLSLPKRNDNNDKYLGTNHQQQKGFVRPHRKVIHTPPGIPLTIFTIVTRPEWSGVWYKQAKKVWLGTAFLFNGFHQVGGPSCRRPNRVSHRQGRSL